MADDLLPQNAVAIVGMAVRVPGASSVERFWRNLCEGVESVSRFTEAELEDCFGDDIRRAPNFVKARPILDDVDQFDAAFFGMHAREAELTDPQHRVFLECAWQALEDAGCDPAHAAGAIGVFAGCSMNTYLLDNVCGDRRAAEEFTSNYQVGGYPLLVGALQDFLATRVSYKLDLKGPSMTVQSACSTSLLAVAQACQSLLLYQCDAALAGGVSITFPQKRGYLHQDGGMVSADGSCRSFDAEASGTIFGSGCGVVLLKRLENALADGDRIYAVVRGCGVNNDGAAKVGFTAPSVDGQAAAIELALAAADVEARSIGYVECHGTATPLGDPIEVAGLTQAFRASTADRGFCALGSVKTNVGHLDAAAGVTGLIKTALALQHAQLPPSLHFRQPNPQIDFEASPFYVNARHADWPRRQTPRRAGVSAFGVGGTNVHVVLEEAPPTPPRLASAVGARAAQLLVLSARSPAALQAARLNLAAHLRQHPELDLADVAWSLQTGRRAFAHRCALVCRDLADAVAKLESGAGQVGIARAAAPLVFMFPGQGAQYPEMGRDLYDHEPVFRAAIDRCAELLRPCLAFDLGELLYRSKNLAHATERLSATAVAQPAIFAVEYATACLWISWGLRPCSMIGHSVGEFVAAVLAGVFSLEDALALVAARGQMMQALPAGAMLAVRLPEADVAPLLSAELAIAAINAPSLCVVSGPLAGIVALERVLSARGVASGRLHTSHAFHSPMVEPIIEPLRERLCAIDLAPPSIPYLSCVTGTWGTAQDATSPEYWAAHARRPVRFADGIATLVAGDAPVLLEVGPGSTLATLARQATRGRDLQILSSLPGAAREAADRDCMLDALGQLWTAGAEPDWRAVHDSAGQRVTLPTYPFERRRHWIDPPARSAAAGAAAAMSAVVARTPVQSPALQDASATAPRPAEEGIDAARAAVVAILEELSGEQLASANRSATFLELGFDSLFLSQVAQRVQSRFRIAITFRQLLGELSTIGALAARVAAGSLQAETATPEIPPPAIDAGASATRFEVYRQPAAPADATLTPVQQDHIAALVARCDARGSGSRRMTQEFRAVLADPRAAAGFRGEWKDLVFPIVCARSAGSKIWDVDGNEYVDLVNGYGQTAFGHAPDFVVAAIKAQIDQGFAIGPQSPLAGEVAALFCEITGNQRMTFCNTGSEAVMAAMRVARAVTGRDLVVTFAGDYHGQFDEVLVRGVQQAGQAPRSMPVATGIPASAVSNMVVLEYGAAASLQWIREHAQDLAAVVTEPVQSRHPDLVPLEFLRELRRITEASGTALVMDEVVTGFRVHPGGMQALTGIRADLATYGKVVGGGLPIGILAGTARFMDALDGGAWQYGDDSFPQAAVTFFAGTFVRHPLALAACRAVLGHVKTHGPALQEQLSARTAQLVSSLRAEFDAYAIGAKIEHYASWFYFNLHTEHPLAPLLFHHLRERGVHAQDGYPCFLTTAHSDADLQHIVDAFRAGLAALSAAGIIGARTPADRRAADAESAPVEVPLTESQAEIWLVAQLGDAASCSFNESVTLHLQGRLDSAALHAALASLVERHDALRATFTPTGEAMRIAPTLSLPCPLTDLSQREAAPAAASFARLLDEEARTAFDLVGGPLVRAQLVRRSASAHELVLTLHHIVCDGWSVNVLVREFAALYAALSGGGSATLAPPPSFAGYAQAQQRRDAAELATVEAFWLRQFDDVPGPLDLPTDRPRAVIRTFSGGSRGRRIDAPLYKALKAAGAAQGCTLFVSLLAAFQMLVGRLAGQEEVVVGVPAAGQSLLDAQDLVGHCVNFLPIRGRWSDATSLADFMKASRQSVLDAYEHQSYTLGTLVRRLNLRRGPQRVPLTQVQFNLERLPDRLRAAGLGIEVEPNAKAQVNFDLFLNVIESAQGLRLDCDYNTDLFDASTIDLWLECYQTVLENVVADAAQRVTRFPYLPLALRDAARLAANRSEADYPRDRCAHQLFELQARATPQALAAHGGGGSISYAELDQRANQLAHHLLARIGDAGAAAPRLVGILMERSLELLVAMLATMKAGLAYLPLDPGHPPARLRHVIADAGLAALVSDVADAAALVGGSLPVIRPQRDAAAIWVEPRSPPPVAVAADRPAYVIYTSGSTGLPKGVAVSHRSLVNLLSAMALRPGLGRLDVLFAITTVAFDIAALELLLPLTVGAKVVIAAREDIADGSRLLQQMRACGANVMQATPAGWRLLLEAGFRAPPGFRMLCGGEALSRELADRLLAGSGELWNMYGPTETTIWSSCARIRPGDGPVTVGEPIANTQFHVLDRYDQPVPAGVPGQLHIGGDGVALGYHGRSELTAERFIANPFGDGRLYRSGDLARRLPDGRVQVLGRMDDQIKLRGFRIEPGEIESVLLTRGGVAEAAVMLRENSPGQQRLVAYFVPAPGRPRTPEQLRAALAQQLPDYMMPSAWMQLAAFPLSVNGKMDRASLPEPGETPAAPKERVLPRNPIEATLLAIWAEVLHSDQVSTTDDVFDLGVDSIQLFQIAARASRAGLQVTAKQVMLHRTIVELARLLELPAPEPDDDDDDAPPPPQTLRQFKQARVRKSAR